VKLAGAIAAVGLSCRDHVWHVERFPPTHSRTAASAYRVDGGGPAATAAVAAARLGVSARLYAIHGDDEEGRANARDLAGYGVDLRGVRTPPNARSFVSAVLIDPRGERFIFPYRGDALVDDPDAHDWSDFAGVGAILTDARHPRLADRALTLAAAAGIPSVGDWGDLRESALRARIDHLIFAEEAAREALGGGPADPVELALAALPHLRSHARQFVAVTLGAHGSVYDDGVGIWHQPSARVAVVESNGAGDAFHGAYAAVLANVHPPAIAIRLATAVAALRCTGIGRGALPDAERAVAFARSLPTPIPFHRGGTA
jgi:sulfofructose kinase